MRAFGPLVLTDTLRADELTGVRAYFNARYLLAAASAAPIPATKTLGLLAPQFVERAAAEMLWQPEPPDIVRYVRRVQEEPDVLGLHLLRTALENGGLLRLYRSAFHATRRAHDLLGEGHEGEFFLALFLAYFVQTELARFDRYSADPVLQAAVPALLWRLRLEAGDLTIGDVVDALTVDPVRWQEGSPEAARERLGVALRGRILYPLEELGLVAVTHAADGSPSPGDLESGIAGSPLLRRFAIPVATLN
ncbi:MAG: hypothetical protein R2826_07900 [Thermoleophilia bacterium]